MSLKETLSGGDRKTYEEMVLESRLSLALKQLIETTQARLSSNQIDRDSGTDLSPEYRRHDAFFALSSNMEAVLKLTSVGSPQESGDSGLFIKIHELAKNGPMLALSLQTAKDPGSVDASDVRWLSGFTSDQLLEISELIKIAQPIEPQEYEEFITSKT